MKWLKWFKRKDPVIANAWMIKSSVSRYPAPAEPARECWESYIKYAERLKVALLTGNTSEQRLCEKYLKSKGFEVPTTLSACDKLIEEVGAWG